MATDDERRRVAERLRRMVAVGLPPWVGYTYDAVMGYMPLVGQDSAYHESSYREYCLRLADLIEPSCDRDALLELADEMDRRQHDVATAATDGVVDAWCLREYADLIREALGVTDG